MATRIRQYRAWTATRSSYAEAQTRGLDPAEGIIVAKARLAEEGFTEFIGEVPVTNGPNFIVGPLLPKAKRRRAIS